MSTSDPKEPVAWIGTAAEADDIMRKALEAVADYRKTYWLDPTEIQLSPFDWDTVVGNTSYYPAETAHRPAWPHERRFYDPSKGPRHGTLFGIKAASDEDVEPGHVRLT